MSKELTPLEALKDIERVCRDSNYVADFYNQRLDIIETALKAFEIIKEKSVDTIRLLYCESVEEYNNELTHPRNNDWLTQEEFDLLKEVLK